MGVSEQKPATFPTIALRLVRRLLLRTGTGHHTHLGAHRLPDSSVTTELSCPRLSPLDNPSVPGDPKQKKPL